MRNYWIGCLFCCLCAVAAFYFIGLEKPVAETLSVSGTSCDKYQSLFVDSENPSRFLGQAEQESSCNPFAKSPFAVGLMQFTPQTADWVEDGICRSLGKARLESPVWSAGCSQLYMAWLEGKSPTTGKYCDTKMNAERSYNGGLAWLNREAKLTSNHSYVGLVRACNLTKRSEANCHENTSYAPYISKRQIKYLPLGGKQC